ncbi:MAG TPA: hypothetical protein VGW34_03240 [Allosphingosinicella sp.]|nr:hypothetical protein [Allosphingosinicella sp.]
MITAKLVRSRSIRLDQHRIMEVHRAAEVGSGARYWLIVCVNQGVVTRMALSDEAFDALAEARYALLNDEATPLQSEWVEVRDSPFPSAARDASPGGTCAGAPPNGAGGFIEAGAAGAHESNVDD